MALGLVEASLGLCWHDRRSSIRITPELEAEHRKDVRPGVESEAIQDGWPEYGTHCWGCGRNNEHGLRIKSHWDNDETVCSWQPEKYHLAFPGSLNGGIIATLIDCHCLNTAHAAALRAQGGQQGAEPLSAYVTGSLSVKYVRPTPVDRPVVLRARVKEMTERKTVVTCSLFSDGVECASGEVVAVKLDLGRSQE